MNYFGISTPMTLRIEEAEKIFLASTDGNEKPIIVLSYGEASQLLTEIGETNNYATKLKALLDKTITEFSAGISIYRLLDKPVKEKIINLPTKKGDAKNVYLRYP